MYAPNNAETAKTISDTLGTQTIVLENVSTSSSKGGTSRSVSQQVQSRPLMSVDDIMRLEGPKKDASGMIIEPGEMLVKVAGFPPIRGRQILYFMDPIFSARSKYSSDVYPSLQSDVLMKDLKRTYVRPKYDWISEDEYKKNVAEDQAIIAAMEMEKLPSKSQDDQTEDAHKASDAASTIDQDEQWNMYDDLEAREAALFSGGDKKGAIDEHKEDKQTQDPEDVPDAEASASTQETSDGASEEDTEDDY